MQYDLRNEYDRERLRARFEKDIVSGAIVDYTRHQFKTPNQNRYLHLLIGVVAMETGTSIEYAKSEYFKRLVNHETFAYLEEDAVLHRTAEKLKSITIIPCEILSKCIDKFKMWGREQGWKMPDADEESILQLIEIEMAKYKYL